MGLLTTSTPTPVSYPSTPKLYLSWTAIDDDSTDITKKVHNIYNLLQKDFPQYVISLTNNDPQLSMTNSASCDIFICCINAEYCTSKVCETELINNYGKKIIIYLNIGNHNWIPDDDKNGWLSYLLDKESWIDCRTSLIKGYSTLSSLISNKLTNKQDSSKLLEQTARLEQYKSYQRIEYIRKSLRTIAGAQIALAFIGFGVWTYITSLVTLILAIKTFHLTRNNVQFGTANGEHIVRMIMRCLILCGIEFIAICSIAVFVIWNGNFTFNCSGSDNFQFVCNAVYNTNVVSWNNYQALNFPYISINDGGANSNFVINSFDLMWSWISSTATPIIILVQVFLLFVMKYCWTAKSDVLSKYNTENYMEANYSSLLEHNNNFQQMKRSALRYLANIQLAFSILILFCSWSFLSVIFGLIAAIYGRKFTKNYHQYVNTNGHPMRVILILCLVFSSIELVLNVLITLFGYFSAISIYCMFATCNLVSISTNEKQLQCGVNTQGYNLQFFNVLRIDIFGEDTFIGNGFMEWPPLLQWSTIYSLTSPVVSIMNIIISAIIYQCWYIAKLSKEEKSVNNENNITTSSSTSINTMNNSTIILNPILNTNNTIYHYNNENTTTSIEEFGEVRKSTAPVLFLE